MNSLPQNSEPGDANQFSQSRQDELQASRAQNSQSDQSQADRIAQWQADVNQSYQQGPMSQNSTQHVHVPVSPNSRGSMESDATDVAVSDSSIDEAVSVVPISGSGPPTRPFALADVVPLPIQALENSTNLHEEAEATNPTCILN